MESVVGKVRGQSSYLDTLASLLSRLGELDRATLLEREALALGDPSLHGFYASQLARLELARVLSSSVAPEEERILSWQVVETQESRTNLTFSFGAWPASQLEGSTQKGLEIHAVVLRKGAPAAESLLGYLRARLGIQPPHTVALEGNLELPSADTQWVVVYVTGIDSSEFEGPSLEYWPLDPAVLSYPPVGDLAPSSQRARDQRGAGR